jgi:hypothetical protein
VEYPRYISTQKGVVCMQQLKGHASLCKENLQLDKQRKGREKIRAWERMEAKLKGKFLPVTTC